MSARFVAGDLFASPGLSALAHGANCAGAMGKGIATEFKRRWPAMYREYVARCRDGRFALGGLFAWDAGGGLTVYNLGTEAHWRTGADLDAIERSVAAMLAHATEHGVRRIGMPRIGAGLGGLPWERVRAVLERLAGAGPVELVVFEDFRAGVVVE